MFDTLGVKRVATDEEIKHRYKELYQKADEKQKKKLNHAKMILLNPEEKANYIASLEESGCNDGMIEWGGTGLEELK